MDKKVDAQSLEKILRAFDEEIGKSRKPTVHLLAGGGGALIGAYKYQEATADFDALVLQGNLSDFAPEIAAVAKKLDLPADWLNPYFSTFTIYLPKDYRSRCVKIYQGENLLVEALGSQDLLVMKLMAGRSKDHSHILFLAKQAVNFAAIEDRLIELEKLFPKEAGRALELFDDLLGER
ncbi:MAG: hypothetical protein C5B49_13755 [Bdellovibrio sp.]|nr:MAG: hypothetical protein C5B49_13755 [Bdellovibrio sp.]